MKTIFDLKRVASMKVIHDIERHIEYAMASGHNLVKINDLFIGDETRKELESSGFTIEEHVPMILTGHTPISYTKYVIHWGQKKENVNSD